MAFHQNISTALIRPLYDVLRSVRFLAVQSRTRRILSRWCGMMVTLAMFFWRCGIGRSLASSSFGIPLAFCLPSPPLAPHPPSHLHKGPSQLHSDVRLIKSLFTGRSSPDRESYLGAFGFATLSLTHRPSGEHERSRGCCSSGHPLEVRN